MKHRLVLFLGLLCLSPLAVGQRPPNIVFFLVDDLGQRDLGCYGSTFYETPNLDRLAKQGALFTDAYAACPVCSPMTGDPDETRNLAGDEEHRSVIEAHAALLKTRLEAPAPEGLEIGELHKVAPATQPARPRTNREQLFQRRDTNKGWRTHP